MTTGLQQRDLTLANMFVIVPEVADLVVKSLDPGDTKRLMLEVDPAITSFCNSQNGGSGSILEIERKKQAREEKIAQIAISTLSPGRRMA